MGHTGLQMELKAKMGKNVPFFPVENGINRIFICAKMDKVYPAQAEN